MHPVGQEREPLHLHGAREDDDAEREAHDDLELQSAVRGGAGRVLRVGRRLDTLLAVAGRGFHDVVAGAANRLHEVSIRRLARDVRDGRLLGREIDVGSENAGWRAKRLLHPADATRARHADDRQGLLCGHDSVARSLDGGDEVARRDGAGVEGDRRLLGGEVDRRLVHAVDLADGALGPGYATGAGHACDRQIDGGVAVAHGPSLVVIDVLGILFPGPNDDTPRGTPSRASSRSGSEASRAPTRRRSPPRYDCPGQAATRRLTHDDLGRPARDHRSGAARAASAPSSR